MSRTFNLGLGMVFVVKPDKKEQVLKILQGEKATLVGELINRKSDAVIIQGLQEAFPPKTDLVKPRKIRTAVLISGRGSNMQVNI